MLERHAVRGYTVNHGLSGRGDRGVHAGDSLAGELSTAAVVVACYQAEADELIKELRTLLTGFGGICPVSDALWLKH